MQNQQNAAFSSLPADDSGQVGSGGPWAKEADQGRPSARLSPVARIGPVPVAPRRAPVVLGATAVALGVVLNQWTVGFALADDGQIGHPILVYGLALFQLCAIGLGLFLVVRKPAIPYREMALMAFGTCVSVGMLELGSRLWLGSLATPDQARIYTLGSEVAPSDFQWSQHHYLNYYPTPNFQRGKTAHNSLGYRDREFPVEKPAGTFRVVALGGSTTYTVNVEDNEKMFTRQLENILRDEYGYENVEVINAGVAGYDSFESLINLQFRALDLDPDLVIVYHGTNDVHNRLVEAGMYRGDNSGRRQPWTPPTTSTVIEYSVLARIVSHKLALGHFLSQGLESYVGAPTYQGQASTNPATDPAALLDTNRPVYFERNLSNIVGTARTHGADVLLATWAHSPHMNDYAATPHYQRGFRENNAVVADVAHDQGASLFDFASVMPTAKDYWSDGRHVNEAGAREKAELFAGYLDQSGMLASVKRSEL